MKETPNYRRATALFGMLLIASWCGLRAEDVPIKGQFVGQSNIIPEATSEVVFRLENSATGKLSHVGRVRAQWVVRSVKLDLANRQLIVAQPDWIGTITAENGNQLFGRYVFRSTVLPISASGEVEFELDLIITGGNGRFAGAVGHGVAIGKASGLTGASVIELTGTITTVGSSLK